MSDGFVQVDGELTLSLEGGSSTATANNLTTTEAGYALDARQGKVLDEKKLDKTSVLNNLITIAAGFALDARQGKWLDENKINYGDIVNNLTTNDTGKVLSAAQGYAISTALTEALNQLKGAVDSIGEIKVDVDALNATFTITEDAVDMNGKFVDNALFR